MLRLHRRYRLRAHHWVHDNTSNFGIWLVASAVGAWLCTWAVSRIGPVLDLGPVGQDRLNLSSFFFLATAALAWGSVRPGRFSWQAELIGVVVGLVFWISCFTTLIPG